jgi:hypothetical protein
MDVFAAYSSIMMDKTIDQRCLEQSTNAHGQTLTCQNNHNYQYLHESSLICKSLPNLEIMWAVQTIFEIGAIMLTKTVKLKYPVLI